MAGHDGPAKGFGPGLKHGQSLRVDGAVDEKPRRFGFRRTLRHGHRLGSGGALVQHGGVGHIQARQVADHRLVIQQRFETTLADLGLVRRVGGVPGRIFENIPLDHARNHRPVVSHADQRCANLILGRDPAEEIQSFGLGHGCAGVERRLLPDGCGQGLAHEVLERLRAHNLEHFLDIGGRGADVAPFKSGGGGMRGARAFG